MESARRVLAAAGAAAIVLLWWWLVAGPSETALRGLDIAGAAATGGDEPSALAAVRPLSLPAAASEQRPPAGFEERAPESIVPAALAALPRSQVRRWESGRHYTRFRRNVYGGRFGGRRSLVARCCCGRRSLGRVVVIFGKGRPVAGAECRANDGTVMVTTDAQGEAHSATGEAVKTEHVTGAWYLDGRRLYVRHWHSRDAQGRSVLQLWPGGRELDGRVVDQHGNAMAGVVVHITGVATHTATTGADGRFRVAECTPSRLRVTVEHSLLFRHPMPDHIDPGRPGPNTITVHAVRGEPHEVVVVDDDGAPLDGATVKYQYRWPVRTDGRRQQWTYTATSNAAGLASILVVPGQELQATVACKGYPGRELRGLARLMPRRLDVRLRTKWVKSWLPLRCRDADTGADLHPQTILARRAEQPWIVGQPYRHVEHAVCHPGGEIDAGEDFEVLDFTNLPLGEWEFFLWSPGYAPAVVSGQVTPKGIYPPLDVRLQPAAETIRVRVAARGTGATVSRASIHVMAAPGQGGFLHAARFTRAADARYGTAEFELPPGVYDVKAGAAGYPARTQRFTVTAATEVLIMRLDPATE